MKKTTGRHGRSRQTGQGLVEMGIVVLLMVTLVMGVVELGRILLILNMITNSTRDAARAASAMGKTSRAASDGHLCAAREAEIKSMVVGQMNGYITIVPANVTVTYVTLGGGPTRTVRVLTTVSVPYVAWFKVFGTSLPVSQAVEFRDEITAGGTGC